MNPHNPWTFCVAPMMGLTDRHFRVFFRLMSRHARLYTEMVTAQALIHGDKSRFLTFDEIEHPVALQLGGSNPTDLAQCAKWAAQAGFDEVNLNVGCPSDRVQSGQFGACMMASPKLVAECVNAMKQATDIPVTVKCRVGIDELDSDQYFNDFIDTVAEAGCEVFLVHARKAWLQGLNPKQNREIPTLNHARVHALKTRRPDLTVVLNGGIDNLNQCEQALEHVDGVMVGRAAYYDITDFMDLDATLFNSRSPIESKHAWIEQYCQYIEKQLAKDVPLKTMTKHILSVFNGEKGAKAWRRYLSTYAHKPGAGVQLVKLALSELQCSVPEIDR